MAKKNEGGGTLSDMETVRYLLASWVLVRGKGGGFGKMVYRSFKTVFHLYNICTFPSYEEVSKYWKTSVLPPIHLSVEGTSEVCTDF